MGQSQRLSVEAEVGAESVRIAKPASDGERFTALGHGRLEVAQRLAGNGGDSQPDRERIVVTRLPELQYGSAGHRSGLLGFMEHDQVEALDGRRPSRRSRRSIGAVKGDRQLSGALP